MGSAMCTCHLEQPVLRLRRTHSKPNYHNNQNLSAHVTTPSAASHTSTTTTTQGGATISLLRSSRQSHQRSPNSNNSAVAEAALLAGGGSGDGTATASTTHHRPYAMPGSILPLTNAVNHPPHSDGGGIAEYTRGDDGDGDGDGGGEGQGTNNDDYFSYSIFRLGSGQKDASSGAPSFHSCSQRRSFQPLDLPLHMQGALMLQSPCDNPFQISSSNREDHDGGGDEQLALDSLEAVLVA